MPKISLILKDPRSTKDTAIIILYTCADGRLKYYTGESVHPSKFPHLLPRGTIAVLNRLQATIEDSTHAAKIKNEPLTRELLRSRLDATLKRNRTSDSLFPAMQAVIKKIVAGEIVTKKGKLYDPKSVGRLSYTISKLQAFDPTLTVAGVTIETFHRFSAWCHAKDYSMNYTGEHIKNWKTLGKLVGGNDIYSDKSFKRTNEDTFGVFLDAKELKAIYKVQLPGRLDLARDWFLIGCYTGLRVSDVLRLSKQNLSKKYITIANEKTDEKVVIPVHPVVKAIIEKYKGFPPVITDVEINRLIKKVAEKAGIDDDVLYTVTKGGKRKDFYLKKWEMVTTHSGRRSLITNLLRAKVSETFIMKITGIKSFATLKRYSKLTSEDAAKIMAEHPFFK